MRIDRFQAAFILLTLITGLVLAYSVLFFMAPPVQMQFGAWVRQMVSGSANGNADQSPLPTQSAALGFALEQEGDPTAAPSPSMTLTAESPVQAQDPAPTQEPRNLEPTRTPVYQVIEDPIPDGDLVIPSLSIDQPVVPVSVRFREWDLEGLGPDIGWLQTTGSHPNDELAMVLVGHVTLPYFGSAGPFLYLSNLKPGDVVEYRSGERTYTYTVVSEKTVEPDQVDYLYQPDGSRLLLVTCTGYNPITMQYDLRLVVEAVLLSEAEAVNPQ